MIYLWVMTGIDGYLCVDTCVLVICHRRSGPKVVDRVPKTFDALEAEDLVKSLKIFCLGFKGSIDRKMWELVCCSFGIEEFLGSGELW